MSNIYLARLEAALSTRYSKHTRRASLRHAQGFLESVGLKAQYTRQDVVTYLDALVKHGYRESSIHAMIAGVKQMFVVNSLDLAAEPNRHALGDAPRRTPWSVADRERSWPADCPRQDDLASAQDRCCSFDNLRPAAGKS